MPENYIIEARNEDGSLSLADPQPEQAFGLAAIRGISEDHMVRVIFARCPDATLTGENIAAWPRVIDPRFVARRKTW